MTAGPAIRRRWPGLRGGITLAALLAALGLLLAHAHLVHVALSTQPDCVRPAPDDPAARHRPARPGC